MPCLAALMWRNPSKNYYVLPPEFNVRPNTPAGVGAADPWLIHTLYGADTLAQQLGSVSNGTWSANPNPTPSPNPNPNANPIPDPDPNPNPNPDPNPNQLASAA